MTKPGDFSPFDDLLADREVPVYGVLLLRYLDAEGDSGTTWRVVGDATRQDMAGLLEISKYDILRGYLAELVSDPED